MQCGLCGAKIKAIRGNCKIDGTFPRYYACYLGNLSPRELLLDGRQKCESTHIHAEELEAYVWDYVTFALTGGVLDSEKKSEFEIVAINRFEQFSGDNIIDRVKSVDDGLKRLLDDKIKKKRASNRLFEMLENEDISVDSIRKRIKANEQEICSIEEQIKQAESDLFDLQEIQKNVSAFVDSEDLLFEIWNSLQEFATEDRKALIESLLSERIQVVPKNKFLGPTTVTIKLRWNDDIFRTFTNENKLPPFGKNGSDHSTTNAPE